jgi:hypothetical protein
LELSKTEKEPEGEGKKKIKSRGKLNWRKQRNKFKENIARTGR